MALLATGLATSSTPALAQARRGNAASRPPAVRPSPPARSPKTSKADKNNGTDHAPIDQFIRMSPEERQKALANLPPERAEKLRKQLSEYNKMTPQQQAAAREQLNAFRNLPPERQEKLRKAFARFSENPAERQQEMRQELNQLRGMTEADRKARLNSPEFKDRFDNNERKIVREMSDVLPNQ